MGCSTARVRAPGAKAPRKVELRRFPRRRSASGVLAVGKGAALLSATTAARALPTPGCSGPTNGLRAERLAATTPPTLAGPTRPGARGRMLTATSGATAAGLREARAGFDGPRWLRPKVSVGTAVATVSVEFPGVSLEIVGRVVSWSGAAPGSRGPPGRVPAAGLARLAAVAASTWLGAVGQFPAPAPSVAATSEPGRLSLCRARHPCQLPRPTTSSSTPSQAARRQRRWPSCGEATGGGSCARMAAHSGAGGSWP